MLIKAGRVVFNSEHIQKNSTIEVNVNSKDNNKVYNFGGCFAYPPFCNSHEHLVGNWYPRAGDHRPYINSHIWVEDMKNADSYKERNRVWVNDGSFDLLKGNAPMLTTLGIYKNLFSGVGVVQDHSPIQKDEYYKTSPIQIVKDYRQCHSLTLGNWWGGEEPEEEWRLSKGKLPFIIHLGEGFDNQTRNEFKKLKQMDLLKPNTVLIHAVSLTESEIDECAENGTSICWCPSSNYFLLGETLNITHCLKTGVNVVLGTDSSLSGSVNLFHELQYAKTKFPEIAVKDFYKMFTVNSRRALFLDESFGELQEQNDSVLLIKSLKKDPFDNLLHVGIKDIELFILKGRPLYGERKHLIEFNVDEKDYYIFKIDNKEKFVYGHPEKITNKVEKMLGYKKDLPYLPF